MPLVAEISVVYLFKINLMRMLLPFFGLDSIVKSQFLESSPRTLRCLLSILGATLTSNLITMEQEDGSS